MCGRFTETMDGNDLWNYIEKTVPNLPDATIDQFDLFLRKEYHKRYNIVPTSYVPIIMVDEVVLMTTAHWWLLPSWGSEQVTFRTTSDGKKTLRWTGPPKSHFNSKFDTITNPQNKYWTSLLAHQRCLIPADGFMEWQDEKMIPKGSPKASKYFFLNKRKPFFFAGVYDKAKDDEGKIFLSTNIITVNPNELLTALPHHRMPAILSDGDVESWLDPTTEFEDARALLKTLATDQMDGYEISNLVNYAKNDSEAVIAPKQ